jgi:hypothetical protein
VEDRLKYIFAEVKTLNGQEWHIALEMPTWRTAHAKNGGESTPAKQYQGKAWETKSQQDLSINVAINSRLLASNAEIR